MNVHITIHTIKFCTVAAMDELEPYLCHSVKHYIQGKTGFRIIYTVGVIL
jgi:hypothetical protein